MHLDLRCLAIKNRGVYREPEPILFCADSPVLVQLDQGTWTSVAIAAPLSVVRLTGQSYEGKAMHFHQVSCSGSRQGQNAFSQIMLCWILPWKNGREASFSPPSEFSLSPSTLSFFGTGSQRRGGVGGGLDLLSIPPPSCGRYNPPKRRRKETGQRKRRRRRRRRGGGDAGG